MTWMTRGTITRVRTASDGKTSAALTTNRIVPSVNSIPNGGLITIAAGLVNAQIMSRTNRVTPRIALNVSAMIGGVVHCTKGAIFQPDETAIEITTDRNVPGSDAATS